MVLEGRGSCMGSFLQEGGRQGLGWKEGMHQVCRRWLAGWERGRGALTKLDWAGGRKGSMKRDLDTLLVAKLWSMGSTVPVGVQARVGD
jgi:hypothetical protein